MFKYEIREHEGWYEIVKCFYNRFNGSLEKQRFVELFDDESEALEWAAHLNG